MSNTNIDYLFPEFWAAAFDEGNDLRGYNLQEFFSRNFESQLGEKGDTVNVPLVPSMTAADWTPGDAITASGITQTVAQLILNKSKKTTINLTSKELSLSAYDLVKNYGVPMAEAILSAVNTEIYKEALKSSYFVNDPATALDEDKVVDAKTLLDNNKVGKAGRFAIFAPDDIGVLLKKDAFQYANYAGDMGAAMKEGELIRKFGFAIAENFVIADYTPADLTGAVNLSGGYAKGTATAIAVDGYNDDANPHRDGDIIKFSAGTYHSILTPTFTSSDTTGYKALYNGGGLRAAVANNEVITTTASRSALCGVPSALAVAARPYAQIPDGAGVRSFIANYRSLPVRISIWHDGNLGINVQFDVLFGCKLVNEKRLVRIIC